MSDREIWQAVDNYIAEHLIGEDADLDAALADSAEAGLPAIAVSPAQGKLLQLIARSIGARRILEIGTLGGYSTIWLARALPADGRLVTLELEERHATVARANLARAGLGNLVEVRVGPALESLQAMAADGTQEKQDLVFIDADKGRIPQYFDLCVRLTRPGGVIVTDNVVRDGALAQSDSSDVNIRGVQAFHEMLRSRTDVDSTTVQTVGTKGYDGFNLAVVR